MQKIAAENNLSETKIMDGPLSIHLTTTVLGFFTPELNLICVVMELPWLLLSTLF